MGKKIVLVNQHTAYLFIDIANAFAENYDEVVLMAGVIHPLGNELSEKITVHKICPYDKSNTYTRLRSWLKGFFQVAKALLINYKSHELFLYSNPPIIVFLTFFFRRRTSFLMVDVYPDALISTGMLQSDRGLIYRAWEFLNKRSFRRLVSISTITSSMSNKINKYLKNEITTVIPLWTDNSLSKVRINRQENEFFEKYNLDPEKFYVTYSGNLGKGHSIETIVEVAKVLKENDDINFIIAGEGFKEKTIKSLVEEYKLTNVLLLPYQERNAFINLINATDLGVVTIDEQNSYVSIPSKVFNLFGAGKPVLCIGKSDSELGKLVLEYDSGKAFEDNQVQPIASYIEKLLHTPSLYNHLKLGSIKASSKHTIKNAKEFVKLHISG